MSELKDEIKISVVICAYNEARLVGDCLEGLKAQTYPKTHFEAVVIENESKDSTPEIVRSIIEKGNGDKTMIRMIRKKHGGVSESRNLGIKESQFDIIAFLDADAVPDPKWLEKLADEFRAGADYVGGRINLLNSDSTIAQIVQLTRHVQVFGPEVYSEHLIGCNMAFRRSIFDEHGGFYENFTSRGDESNLSARMMGGSYLYRGAPEAIVLHERSQSVSDNLRIEWKAGLVAELGRAVNRDNTSLREWCLIAEQLIIVLVIPSFFLWLIGLQWALLPLGMGALSSFRRLFGKKLARIVFRGLRKQYGWVMGFVLSYIYMYVMATIRLFTGVIGRFLYRNATGVLPMTTRPIVLEDISTFEKESK